MTDDAHDPDRLPSLVRTGEWEEALAQADDDIERLRQVDLDDETRLGEIGGVLIWKALALERLGRRTAATDALRRGIGDYDALGLEPEGENRLWREGRELLARLTGEWTVEPTRAVDDGWGQATPAEVGLDPAAVEWFRQTCEDTGADACLVARDGQIVMEWYGSMYAEPIATMSSMKSWTALLAALLADQGKLSFDDPTSKWIPEWNAGADAGVTVRHLLSMTSGLRTRPDETSVGYVADKTSYVMTLELDYEPGERFAYSNEGAQLLSPILERAAEEDLGDYAAAYLFDPLGMEHTSLRRDAAGNVNTYADANTTLGDFAKVAQMMLDGGRSMRGRPVIAPCWIETLTTPIPQNSRYGLLWWVEEYGGWPCWETSGYLNTDTLAFANLRLVVARVQRRPFREAASFDSEAYGEFIERSSAQPSE